MPARPDPEPPVRGDERVRAWAAVELLGLALIVLAQLPFAFGTSGPLDTDYGRIFLGPLFQVREALFDGRPLLWDALRYGGTPYWPLPNTAPAYPPLIVALLFLRPVAATNAMLVLHLLLGAWGTRAVARRLGASRAAGFVAGAAYLLAPLTLHYGLNQPWATMALAFLPWALLQVVRRAQGAGWLSCGVAAGLLFSACIWCGGYVVFLPGLMGLGLVALGLALRRPAVRGLLESGAMLAAMVATLVGVGAGRLLPAAAWTRLTDRADALDLKSALGQALRLGEVADWLASTGILTVLLAVLGAGAALIGRRAFAPEPAFAPERSTPRGAVPRAAVLALAFAILALMTFALGWPQRLALYRHAPGFDRVRDPRHFWAPLIVFVPLLTAAGLDALLTGPLRGLRARMPAAPGALAVAALVAALGLETRAWGFVKPQRILSLDERVEANALHQELARRATSGPRFRVHDFRDTRPKLKMTADLVRGALGIESLEGLLGNISIEGYDQELIVPSRQQGPRLWGLLNCAWITSDVELAEPGLKLERVFAEDSDEINPGTDGPYLYENLHALPRAYLAHHAIGLVGMSRDERTGLLADGPWAPRREVLVRIDSEQMDSGDARAALGQLDLVILGEDARADEAYAADARRAGAVVARALTKEVREQDEESEPDPITPLADPRVEHGRVEVELGGVDADAWLVLAETFAIYPGWLAEVDGVETPLWIANGAATALRVSAGARRVRLTYVPPGLRAGVAISAVSLLAAGLVLVLARRRAKEECRGQAAKDG